MKDVSLRARRVVRGSVEVSFPGDFLLGLRGRRLLRALGLRWRAFRTTADLHFFRAAARGQARDNCEKEASSPPTWAIENHERVETFRKRHEEGGETVCREV